MNRRLSVLAVTSQMPWPLDRGGHLRTFHLLRSLAEAHDVRLVTPCPAGNHQAIEALSDVGIRLCAVPAPPRVPWREMAAVAAAATRREPYVMYARHRHQAVHERLLREAAAEAPDLWYLDHLDSFVYAPAEAPFIVDCHNVYSEVARRTGEGSRRLLHRAYLAHEAHLLTGAEERAAQAATAILAVSDRDARYFARGGCARVYVAPNGVDTAYYRSVRRASTATDPTILFVGTLSWAPNVSAVQFLARVVLPQVQQRFPFARLRVVGADAPPEVMALQALPGVEIAGRVPDMRPHLRDAHLLAVPLDAGGGTRLKILEAFAAGLPVVSTAIGAEGLLAVPDEHLCIAERDVFGRAVTSLLQFPDRAARLATRARRLARDRYDWRAIGAVACTAVEEAVRPDRPSAIAHVPPMGHGLSAVQS